jgi:CheY-like chemotaxis protein
MSPWKVLLIEDDEASQYLYATVLEHHGFEVWIAPSARLAFDLLRERLPHVVVVDIGLPEVDGFEVLAQLRADPRTAAIPAIVATVHVFPEDEVRARLAGCRLFLKKPLQPTALMEAIRQVLEESGGGAV